MTVTLNIKKEKLAEFWKLVEENNFQEPLTDDLETPTSVPQWHIDETRRRLALQDQPAPRLWSEINEEYVRKGI